jgi:hypothetical protein
MIDPIKTSPCEILEKRSHAEKLLRNITDEFLCAKILVGPQGANSEMAR